MLLIDMEKLNINTRKTMIKINNYHILNAGI